MTNQDPLDLVECLVISISNLSHVGQVFCGFCAQENLVGEVHLAVPADQPVGRMAEVGSRPSPPRRASCSWHRRSGPAATPPRYSRTNWKRIRRIRISRRFGSSLPSSISCRNCDELVEEVGVRVVLIGEQVHQLGCKQGAVQGEQMPAKPPPHRLLLELRQRGQFPLEGGGEDDVAEGQRPRSDRRRRISPAWSPWRWPGSSPRAARTA